MVPTSSPVRPRVARGRSRLEIGGAARSRKGLLKVRFTPQRLGMWRGGSLAACGKPVARAVPGGSWAWSGSGTVMFLRFAAGGRLFWPGVKQCRGCSGPARSMSVGPRSRAVSEGALRGHVRPPVRSALVGPAPALVRGRGARGVGRLGSWVGARAATPPGRRPPRQPPGPAARPRRRPPNRPRSAAGTTPTVSAPVIDAQTAAKFGKADINKAWEGVSSLASKFAYNPDLINTRASDLTASDFTAP